MTFRIPPVAAVKNAGFDKRGFDIFVLENFQNTVITFRVDICPVSAFSEMYFQCKMRCRGDLFLLQNMFQQFCRNSGDFSVRSFFIQREKINIRFFHDSNRRVQE